MRIAIVHDWLLGMRGGERVLEVICGIFPDAEVYTLFCDRSRLTPFLQSRRIVPSLLSSLPGVRRHYRALLPIYEIGIRDLSRSLAKAHAERPYDAVVSVSHCVAKNIAVPSGVPHLCYCLTPVRYLWDQYDVYFGRSRLEPVIRRIASRLRRHDVRRAAAVDRFIGISKFIARRIDHYYGRSAGVIYPPVRTDWIEPRADRAPGNGFLCVSALVPYKNVDVVIKAFAGSERQLTVIGSGPEEERLRPLAGPNVRFISGLTDSQLAEHYRDAEALIFAAEEDFGMVPVEMQAAGRPVICLGKGGALETVRGGGMDATGLFFAEPTPESIRSALSAFDRRKDEFTVENCVKQARQFGSARFEFELRSELLELCERHGSHVQDSGAGLSGRLQREPQLQKGGGR